MKAGWVFLRSHIGSAGVGYVWLLVIVYFHFGFLFLDVARVCISGFCMQPGEKRGSKIKERGEESGLRCNTPSCTLRLSILSRIKSQAAAVFLLLELAIIELTTLQQQQPQQPQKGQWCWQRSKFFLAVYDKVPLKDPSGRYHQNFFSPLSLWEL